MRSPLQRYCPQCCAGHVCESRRNVTNRRGGSGGSVSGSPGTRAHGRGRPLLRSAHGHDEADVAEAAALLGLGDRRFAAAAAAEAEGSTTTVAAAELLAHAQQHTQLQQLPSELLRVPGKQS